MNHARPRHPKSLPVDPLRSPPRLLGLIHTRTRRRAPLQTVVPRAWLGWRGEVGWVEDVLLTALRRRNPCLLYLSVSQRLIQT